MCSRKTLISFAGKNGQVKKATDLCTSTGGFVKAANVLLRVKNAVDESVSAVGMSTSLIPI